MALIVEDGTGVAGAEAYATVAAYKAHCDGRGITYGTDSVIEQCLRKGCDYITAVWGQSFKGVRVDGSQALDFPRYHVPKIGVNDGDYLPTEIPPQLPKANIELAIRAATTTLLEDMTQAVKRERIEGAIDITYQDGTSSYKNYPLVDAIVAPLLVGGGRGVALERS